MYNQPTEIKEKHDGGFLTLFKIYRSGEKLYKDPFLIFSLVLAFLLSIISYFFSRNMYEVLQRILDVSIGILPNLLGFNLGAYILIVGFGATEILAKITKPLKGQDNYSLYQKLNGIMGVSVLIQISTLLFIFILKIWDKIQDGFDCLFSDHLVAIINALALLIVLLLVIYCFLILMNVIKQVFIFAQTIHLIIYTGQLKKLKEVDKANEDK